MNILHLITNDKFTVGYIKFMQICMNEYNHVFLIPLFNGKKPEPENNTGEAGNIRYYSDGKWLAFGSEVKKLIAQADKIIVSGVFGIERYLYFWPGHAFRKMYIQYWGGDFYQVRNSLGRNEFREIVNRKMLLFCFRRSHAAIFLINGEYDKFRDITGINKDHVYTAVMPYDPQNAFPYEKYRNNGMHDTVRILVGNSATEENRHEEILNLLHRFSDKNIEVICPLSYGEDAVKTKVTALGKEMFGPKFHPVYEWMDSYDYNVFLSSIDIGIFGNDRQQGMGNIRALLCMGRKVYIRPGTSMFENYRNVGFKCYELDDLQTDSYEELIAFPEKSSNEKLSDSWDTPESMREQWLKVFES